MRMMEYQLKFEKMNLSGELRGSTDASYGKECTIEYLRRVVDWYSGKLRTAVKNSTEAEIYALEKVVKQLLVVKWLLMVEQSGPMNNAHIDESELH